MSSKKKKTEAKNMKPTKGKPETQELKKYIKLFSIFEFSSCTPVSERTMKTKQNK